MTETTAVQGQWIQEAQSLYAQGRLAAAEVLLQRLLAQVPEHVDALLVLGLIEQQRREPQRAQALLARAAALAPTRADVLTNYGNLLRESGRQEDALPFLEQAAKLAPAHALILINLGLVYQDLEQMPQAEQAYRAALAAQPDLAQAHQNLGHFLMRSDLQQARTHLIRALQLNPGLHLAYKDLCAVLLSLGQAEPALALSRSRLQRSPGDQDALAIMLMALHELGLEAQAQQWLNFDVWLKRYTLSAPPGYASLADFNAALQAHVRAHPKLTSVVFGQATHNGKRVNDLLVAPKGPVQLLEHMMLQQLQAYWEALPKMQGSTLMGPMPAPNGLRSWAVLMERNGYETPHIHPDGLVSGVYYVCLPSVVVQGDANHSGWIEFGVPDPVYALRRSAPTRLVQPVAGDMLLFPSYFWHRTIPFNSGQQRLSIAFDLTLTARNASASRLFVDPL